jgi:hypothetical protein
MEFDWTITAWIAGLLFVYIFGLVEGRSKGYKKRKAEEEQEKKEQSSPKPETITVDDPGLLRIKNENGAFALDLDGERVNPISLLPEQRKRLIEILNIMRPWLEGKPAPAPPVTTHQPPLASQPTPTGQTQFKPASVQPISPPPAASPQSLPAVAPGTHSPQMQAPGSVDTTSSSRTSQSKPVAPKPATISKEDRPSAPANSIVTQIDTILQAHLVGTPLDERGIFLTQSPEGGVAVYVGLTRYNEIDEVPDPEIKAAIRAAITEWENKYTPGL